MIWLNFLRDLKSTISRLISVIIITMIAVMVYTALMGIPYNVDLITGSYYDAQNAADYWITGVNLDREDCKKIPIYAMSANAFDEDVKRSLASGMNGHLSKPVNLQVLEKTLQKVLG